MLIKVTQKHIDRGTTSCLECPVALAVNSLLKPNLYTEAGPKYIIIKHVLPNRGSYSMRTPQEVSSFMSHVDNEEFVEPFEFEVDLLCVLVA